MNKKRATRLAKILVGYDGTFNDDDRVSRLAYKLTDEHEHKGTFTARSLKRRLRSFVDRCNNVNIKTIGEFLENPIQKV